MLIEWIVLISVGAVAGFLAGLLGIGGGLVIVPALAWLLADRTPDFAMHMAIATSLASILGTGASSVYAHHRRGAVDWAAAVRLTPGLLVGSLLAAWIAAALSGRHLRIIFGLFCMFAAWRLIRSRLETGPSSRSPGSAELIGAGTGIGIISALVGIGGGTVTVPYLHWRGWTIHRSVATSAACGLSIACAGALGYLWTGSAVDALPGPRLGFIYLPGLAGIVVASVLTAPLGAASAHRLPTAILRRVFGGFLIVVGALLILQR